MSRLSEKIGLYLQLTGWSEVRLAKEIGVTSTTVNRWRRDRAIPTGQKLIKLCKVVPGITIDDLPRPVAAVVPVPGEV